MHLNTTNIIIIAFDFLPIFRPIDDRSVLVQVQAMQWNAFTYPIPKSNGGLSKQVMKLGHEW